MRTMMRKRVFWFPSVLLLLLLGPQSPWCSLVLGWTLSSRVVSSRGLLSGHVNTQTTVLWASLEEPSVDESSPTSSSSRPKKPIQGLLGSNSPYGDMSSSSFDQCQAVHSTLRQLQYDLPRLLQQPLTMEQMALTHSEAVTLVLQVPADRHNNNSTATTPQYVTLVPNRQDLVTLQNALVYLVGLPNRLPSPSSNAAALPFLPPGLPLPPTFNNNQDNDKITSIEAPWIHCRIVVTPPPSSNQTQMTIHQVRVDWKVQLVSPTLWNGTIPNNAVNDLLQGVSSTLLSNAPGAGGGLLKGQSILELDATSSNSQIQRHILTQLTLDGVPVQNAGRFLTRAQSWLGQLQESAPAWMQDLVTRGRANPPVQSLLEQYVAQPLWSQLPPLLPQSQPDSQDETSRKSPLDARLAPIVVARTILVEETAQNIDANEEEELNETSGTTVATSPPKTKKKKKKIYIPIDEYCNETMTTLQNKNATTLIYPLPGSRQWTQYAKVHQAVQNFAESMIPQLADSPKQLPSSWFAKRAKLMGTDGSILVQSATEVCQFYTSLATLRRRTRGTWTLQSATLVKWHQRQLDGRLQVVIRIGYQVQLLLGLGSPAGARGTGGSLSGSDLYTLVLLDSSSREKNHDKSWPNCQITQVRQETLSIDRGGDANAVLTNSAETTLFMKSLVGAIFDPSNNANFLWKASSSAGGLDEWVWQLWDRILPTAATSTSQVASLAASRGLGPAERSDAAAARIYRLMSALHVQGKALVNLQDDIDSGNALPAVEFLSESVQVLGYLNEVLLRGKRQYQQNLGLLVTSLRQGVRSGRLVTAPNAPSAVETIVTLTDSGNVQYTLTFNLRLSLTGGGFAPGDLPFLRGANSNPNGSSGDNNFGTPSTAGLPLSITLRSEYRLDALTGEVLQHVLLESLVNGQLTPADILSRWLQGRSGGGGAGGIWALPDFIQWVRSASRNGP
uniref:Uncharacterized protein n=1 Tax=Entomoneis paludosa TaxID=265537 RepID=A0A6U3DYR9_9STRA|mmetsp:Transcript_40909/g.85177  ORF Transcript_40909/g.85177 Transcript_40909/m.85177 type:complete len:957 (+) Transcript_40909:568-3438(+)